MNPYEVLDVSPRASLKEVNLRYRELLLLHHPDLHIQEGPDAVRVAERQTRELNEAMALLRQQHPKDGVHFGSDGPSFADSADAVSYAWDAPAATRPMACPLCGETFSGGVTAVEHHVKEAHGIDVRQEPKRQRRRRSLSDSDRKLVRAGVTAAAIFALLILAKETGSVDRIRNGELDPIALALFVIWLVILGRTFLRKY